MDLRGLAGRFAGGVHWIDDERFTGACPASIHADAEPPAMVGVRQVGDRLAMVCFSPGCSSAAILSALHLTPQDLIVNSNGNGAGVAQPVEQRTRKAQGAGSIPAASPNSTGHYALAYARRGYRVFPCHEIEADGECSCGKLECPSAGKHPRLKDWQTLATTDEAQIREWWRQWPQANIGVKCGKDSNLTVLDVDGEEGRATLRSLELDHLELPETPIATTGSGGAHYYFAFQDGLQNAVRFAPGLDIRSEGGLVVGVGSKTKRRYEWEALFTLGDDLPPARMPDWLIEKIREANASTNGQAGHLVLPAQIPAGERNNWLYKLTRSLKARGLSATSILLAVQAENSARCAPPMPSEEIRQLVAHATTAPDQQGFLPATTPTGNGVPAIRGPAILTEDYEMAAASNAEYLQRPMIIDRLGFSQGIALAVGGKHHGKTTNVRTVALSVMRGLPVWERATRQGYVIYAASDDEYPTTRMELLRMGWNANSDPLQLARINPDGDPDAVLSGIADLAHRTGAVLIVLDMLFDFARIKDEMGYAHTREAVGKIQMLADDTKSLVLATHHSPKYMTDAMSAATAALGSQGIAARFSPIILTRKWADDLYTVDSTTTRDPRGVAIAPTCLTLDASGWCKTAGAFKAWMKWKMFAERVMGMFEGGEPGKELSTEAVARDLELSRQVVQNTLYNLFKAGRLERQKKGKGFRYWLPVTGEVLVATTDESFESRTYGGESHD